MTDRGIFGLLGVLAVVALVIFLMTPHQTGSTGERIREAAQKQIQETSDRLGTAFDAARKDVQQGPGRRFNKDNNVTQP